MTPKQMYSELAKIAGYTCADGIRFVESNKVLKSNMRHVQDRIRALLEKLNYERSWRDFPRQSTRRATTLGEVIF